MATTINPSPTSRGRTGSRYHMRTTHAYDHPTVGRIFSGVFIQELTGETRTVEIIRYAGADCWKARIKETQSVLCRLGQQVEYAGDSAACSDVTAFLKPQGMRMIQPWEAYSIQ